jgi:hypothetical protein
MLKNTAAGLFVFLTTVLYIKIKLIDSQIFGKLSKEMNKTDILLSIRVIGELLDVMSPKDVVNHLKLVSKTEIEMKKSAKRINDIIKSCEKEEKPLIQLNKKERKMLIQEIDKMLKIIEKRNEAIKAGKLPTFDEMVKKATIHQKNIDEKYRIPKRKKAHSVIRKFSKE